MVPRRAIRLEKLDPGIRETVRILRENGVETLSSCEGRKNPGYHPQQDGPHHGDWPYVIINGATADAFTALAAALKEGLPVRSIEQSWFVFPEAPTVPVGPQWRITLWRKDSSAKSSGPAR
jgi:hypothetical protein